MINEFVFFIIVNTLYNCLNNINYLMQIYFLLFYIINIFQSIFKNLLNISINS